MINRPVSQPGGQKLIRFAGLAVSVLVLFLLSRRVDLQHLASTLRNAHLPWLAVAWLSFGLALLLAAGRWHLVLRLSECAFSPSVTARTVLVGHTFNTLLFGPTGGDIAKAAFYARYSGLATSAILATCVLDRFLGGMGFLALTAGTPGLAFSERPWSERLQQVAQSRYASLWLVVVPALALLGWLIARSPKYRAVLAHVGESLLNNGRQLVARPWIGLLAVLFAVLSHLCVSGVFLFSLMAVTQTTFSLASVFWVFPVISLITAAPVTFSGAGLREGAALILLGRYGIPDHDAIAAALLVLATYLSWALVGGLLALNWPLTRSFSNIPPSGPLPRSN